MRSRKARRILISSGAIAFLLMAAIQVNDPDPLYWIVIYAGVAAALLAAAVGRDMPRLTLVVLGGVIAGLLISAPGFLDYLASGDWGSIGGKMMGELDYVEPAREFLGLSIAAAALLTVLKSGDS